MKKDLIIKPRESDYVLGDGNIKFESVSSSWPVWFNEDQKNPEFETDGCVCFCAQKSLDSQIDVLISNGIIPQSVVDQFISMGFMDTGIDGKPHFHSSPRFLEIQTGNGTSGNSIPEAWDVIRKFGTLPWKDMPFNQMMTQNEYFTPPTSVQLQKASQFLTLMGGKNFCQYHWLINGTVKNTSLMQNAILQAPLCNGIAVSEGWNQTTPSDPPQSQDPQHAVMGYKMEAPVELVTDNYLPYNKVLDAGYPIHYVLQAVVKYLGFVPLPTPQPLPPLPTPLPPNPTNQQISQQVSLWSQWVQAILNWLRNGQ